MPIAHNLGFPPLGPNRELKRATEGYWSGKVSRTDLLRTGAALRAAHWGLQRDAGLDLIPSNDFSYYDRVLDTCALVGAVPARYEWSGGPVDLDTYFAMARGVQAGGRDVTAMEMTKWFDTNYHYIVPEFERGQTFRAASTKPVDEFQEAKALGFHTKPVLIGPVTFVLLGKSRAGAFDRLELLDALLPVYGEVLARLAAAGGTWVRLDEPCLALDRTPQELAAFGRAYRFLAERARGRQLRLATHWARRGARRRHGPAVEQGARAVGERVRRSASPPAARRNQQLRLPLFPTTPIGAFPQTAEVRAARKRPHDGKLPPQEYDAFTADQIA